MMIRHLDDNVDNYACVDCLLRFAFAVSEEAKRKVGTPGAWTTDEIERIRMDAKRRVENTPC